MLNIILIGSVFLIGLFFYSPASAQSADHIQNVFFGQDDGGDYISLDWVSSAPRNFGCERDAVTVWLNRTSPFGTSEGAITGGAQIIGDFYPNHTPSYSGFGKYGFASGFPSASCGTGEPILSTRLPQTLKAYLNPGWSPEQISFSADDFITVQINRYTYNIGFSTLIYNDPVQYYYEAPEEPLPALPFENVQLGYDENDKLVLDFDWVGVSRNIGLVAGINGQVRYDQQASFSADSSKDVSLTLENSFNQNHPIGTLFWLDSNIDLERGQHYTLPIVGLHRWQPTTGSIGCRSSSCSPLPKSSVDPFVGREFNSDDYLTFAFTDLEKSYALSDPTHYTFSEPQDVLPPEITVDSPEAKDYLRSDGLPIQVSASDDLSGLDSLSVSLDGETLSDGTESVDLFLLPLGDHTLSIQATDLAGNSVTETVSFRVVATASGLLADLERAYALGWISSKGSYTELHEAAEKVVKLTEEAEALGDGSSKKDQKQVEVKNDQIYKKLTKDLLESIEKYYPQDKLNQQARDVLVEDINWLLNN